MSSFAILADCTCDFTPEQAESLGIHILPVGVNVENQSFLHYPDCRELSMKDFYSALRAGLNISTSATNPALWMDGVEPILKSGRDVLVVTLASTLTCGYANAQIAAAELAEMYPDRKIVIFDSVCGSMGTGILLEMAVRWRDEGMSLSETAAHMEAAKLHIVHLFTVDSLDHLRRGGRISAATAVFGSVLSIKPILSLDKEGKLFNLDKTRGRKNSIKRLAAYVGELSVGDEEEKRICIAHADCRDDAETLAKELRAEYPQAKISINFLSPVMAAHAGPGALALFFIGKRPKHILP